MPLPADDVCPRCGAPGSRVVDSRPHDLGRKRRRQCDSCGERHSTIEVVILDEGDALDVKGALSRAIESALTALDALRLLRSVLDASPMQTGPHQPVRPLGSIEPVETLHDV